MSAIPTIIAASLPRDDEDTYQVFYADADRTVIDGYTWFTVTDSALAALDAFLARGVVTAYEGFAGCACGCQGQYYRDDSTAIERIVKRLRREAVQGTVVYLNVNRSCASVRLSGNFGGYYPDRESDDDEAAEYGEDHRHGTLLLIEAATKAPVAFTP